MRRLEERFFSKYIAKFYKWASRVSFINAFCDTLYQVTKDSLIPRYFFDWGKYNAPYSKQNVIDRRNYFVLKDINENKNYIFFWCGYLIKDYTGFIDKKNNSVTFCKISSSDYSAFKDDLSGLKMLHQIILLKIMRWSMSFS